MFISEIYCPVTSPNSVRSGIDNPIGILRDHDGDGEFEESEVFVFTKDHLNSVRDLTNLNQKLIQRYNYSAYGKVKLERIADASDSRFVENYFTYTAREWEPEVGEYFYRARYYNPSSGRFLSEDSYGVLSPDGPNPYSYSRNNPVRFTDPTGNFVPAVAIGAVLGAGAVSGFISATATAVTGGDLKEVGRSFLGGFSGGAVGAIGVVSGGFLAGLAAIPAGVAVAVVASGISGDDVTGLIQLDLRNKNVINKMNSCNNE